MNKKISIGIIIGIIIILTALSVKPISFQPSPTVGSITQPNMSKIRSSETIRCIWNTTPDLTSTTVKWYRNDASIITKAVLENYDDLAPEFTSEEDTLKCTVIISNGTNTINSSASIYVEYDPLVYIEGTLIQKNYTISEDQNYTVRWNTTRSSDYYRVESSSGMCVQTIGGTAICSPASEHLGNDKNTSGNQIVYFQYFYNDGNSMQGNKINFTIMAVNDAPEFTVQNITINETDEWNHTIIITDEEGNFNMSYNYTNKTFCSVIELGDRITFNCDPGPTDVGNHTINITVTDNPPAGIDPANTTKSFILEILKVNYPPSITYVSNEPANQSDYYTLIINATDMYDNNTINFSITSNCSINNPWTGVRSNTTIHFDGENITSYGQGIWNGTLTNDHVVCRNITITATDEFGASNTTNIYLNISNINDPPEIHNYSKALDSLNNEYIHNITSYQNAPLIYQVNGTDPDLLVDYNPLLDSFEELLYYDTNETTPWIKNNINNRTGLINISSEEMNKTGNFSILIILTDSQGLNNTKTMNIEVKPNREPYFNQTLNLTCFEYDYLNHNESCYVNLSIYAKDDDLGDYIERFTDNSNIFNITNNGIINFNATQDMVGEHEFNITITDSRGAAHKEKMYLYINNTNNKPVIGTINVPTPPDALYFNKSINNKIYIPVTDQDLELNDTNTTSRKYGYERITINWSNNNGSQNISDYITINQTTQELIINTNLSMGTYNITVHVRDNYFNHTGRNTCDSDNQTIVFTIYNTTYPPTINAVYPYGKPWALETVFDWKNISSSDETTILNISENTTIFFNQSISNKDFNNLTFEWYYDGEKITALSKLGPNNSTLNYYFDFFQAGFNETENHNITLIVMDNFDNSEKDIFTWSIDVKDVNREIRLLSVIPNITVEGSRNKDNKDLWEITFAKGFYDPDYDLDSNELIDYGDMNFSITYNVSDNLCGGYATIDVSDTYVTEEIYYPDLNRNKTVIVGHGMTIKALNNGTCNVTFTATDGEFTDTSNVVFLNVTVVGTEAPSTTEVVQRAGTRTITETQVVERPVPEEIEKPIPIDIVLPDMVTVYENNTIEIPLTITNTWDQTVMGVTLSYKQNGTYNYTVKFDREYFYRLDPGEIIKTKMIVEGYRIGGVYEIIVVANVTDPPYEDTAKIYLNSIEQTSTGAEVKTLIRFAEDLLHKNKECQELTEILDRARNLAAKGELKEAILTLESMIDGCKYLISENRPLPENPKILRQFHVALKKEYLTYLLAIIFVGIIIFGSYTLIHKNKKTDKTKH